MAVEDADELVPFRDVRVIGSTPPALLCGIGDKRIWLPRRHISGKLWCTGDRGTLFIRRWVARDRHLIADPKPSILRRRLRGRLHLVRGDRETPLPSKGSASGAEGSPTLPAAVGHARRKARRLG